MRTWEIEDNRAIPSDLVREQDFILQVRRLNRIGLPHVVINLALTITDPVQGGRGMLESAQDRVSRWGEALGARIAEMSNGDLFIVLESSKYSADLEKQIIAIVWPEGLTEDKRNLVYTRYRLPEDYAALRERINAYVEIVRNAVIAGGEEAPSRLLQTEAARGPINSWSSNQIEKLLNEIDIYKYIRAQPICERKKDGNWHMLFEEFYIAVETLRQERFPKLENLEGSHLFLALCASLDQHLLSSLTDNSERLVGRNIFLNLSVSSTMGSGFAKFTRSIPPANRDQIGFELHVNDLFQNLDAALNSISIIKQEGFGVSIDNISPSVLPYLNLHLIEVDYIKINTEKDKVELLQKPEFLRALTMLPIEKVIFSRCDSEAALMSGLASGVTKFQGWLIDGYIRDAQK